MNEMLLRLTREQKQAIQVFINHSSILDQLVSNTSLLYKEADLLPTNFVASSQIPILKSCIPKEKGWSWNQSNIKTTVHVNEYITVLLRKVSPRKLAGAHSAQTPSFKIWLYEIFDRNRVSYFLWCEKGYQPIVFPQMRCVIQHCSNSLQLLAYESEISNDDGLITPIGKIFPQLVSLQSLSFLKDFMDHRIAAEFGW